MPRDSGSDYSLIDSRLAAARDSGGSKVKLCNQCPALISDVSKLLEASKNQRKTLDTFVDTQGEINKEFRKGIVDLNGKWKYVLGISIGVSSTVSILTMVLGFILKFGAFPVSAYGTAEAAENNGKPMINMVDSGKLLDVPLSAEEEVVFEEPDVVEGSP